MVGTVSHGAAPRMPAGTDHTNTHERPPTMMHTDPWNRAYRTHIVSRWARSRVLRSLHARAEYGATGASDPFTGARIDPISWNELPPVHSSGAFHAYPFGMPRVSDYAR